MSEVNKRGFMVLAGIIIVGGFLCGWFPLVFLPSNGISPAIPVIQVPGEIVTYEWKPFGIALGKDFNLINTMIALFITDAIVLLIALLAYRSSKGWTNYIPGRFQAAIELLVGGLYSLSKSIGGVDAAKKVFPLVGTIFLFLLVANWMSVIPGVESVGKFHCAYPDTNGYGATRINDGLFQLKNETPLNAGTPVTLEQYVACVEETGLGDIHGHTLEDAAKAGLITLDHGHAVLNRPSNPGDQALLDTQVANPNAEGEDDATVNKYAFHVTPFVRPAATDLNLTIGLALISFIVIQIYGFQSQGLGYLQKFIPIGSLGNLGKKPLGAIDLIVGPLELVSEFSKIISLSFRLFGNIFAGGILIIVMLFLLGSGIPVIFYGLELIVGLAQALVFAVLTLVFVSQAMHAHGGDDHDHEHSEAH